MARGRNKAQGDALERFFSGMEVVEATTPLRIFVNKTDVKNAHQGDPERCGIAMSCHRLFGSSAVLIFKGVAYVDLPDEKGIRTVNRFTVPEKTRAQIIHYDKTGEFPPGGFTLDPPSPGRKLDSFRRYTKERAAQIKNGTRKVSPKKSALMKGVARGVKQSALLTGVRNGSGMVHFVKPAA